MPVVFSKCRHRYEGHNRMVYNDGHGGQGIRCRECYNAMRRTYQQERKRALTTDTREPVDA